MTSEQLDNTAVLIYSSEVIIYSYGVTFHRPREPKSTNISVPLCAEPNMSYFSVKRISLYYFFNKLPKYRSKSFDAEFDISSIQRNIDPSRENLCPIVAKKHNGIKLFEYCKHRTICFKHSWEKITRRQQLKRKFTACKVTCTQLVI